MNFEIIGEITEVETIAVSQWEYSHPAGIAPTIWPCALEEAKRVCHGPLSGWDDSSGRDPLV